MINRISREERNSKEIALRSNKVVQAGIAFPSANIQKHLLIVRLNLARPSGTVNKSAQDKQKERNQAVREGLGRLCRLFERIDEGIHKVNVVNEEESRLVGLREFNFSATIGFGVGFFDLLKIKRRKYPRKLREMPDHKALGDPTPYFLGQTDLIIQLGSSSDFVNRWVLENSIQPPVAKPNRNRTLSKLQLENLEIPDIVSAIRGWATIVDVNSGFQRIDNRNLQGFNDGVSNPRRLTPLFDEVVWTTRENDNFEKGTYMVFQKIEHDLDQWRQLDVEEQEYWVGRSKGTGLLLGSLREEEDHELGRKLNDPTVDEKQRNQALHELSKHFDPNNPHMDQSNPETRFFDHKNPKDLNSKSKHSEIAIRCPAWSHVRKANPRMENVLIRSDKKTNLTQKIIFRRGYPYIENGPNGKIHSGLLFISYQKDLGIFEAIKRMLNDVDFPVPSVRPSFSDQELAERHSKGRYTLDELASLSSGQKRLLGLNDKHMLEEAKEAASVTQNTGREGLAGPSKLGVIASGQFLATIPLGGGYYFIPPIPEKAIAKIGDQFF